MNLVVAAFTETYRTMAETMATSIKMNSPGERVKLFKIKKSDKDAHNQKPNIIKKCFKMGCDRVLWLDCDTIIRKSLSGIWGNGDFSVLYRPQGTADFKFNSGITMFKNTKAVRTLVKRWGKLVEKHPGRYDQYTLWLAYKKSADSLNFVPLDVKYNDHRFNEDSVIWHGKGHCRFFKKWKREYAKYESEKRSEKR